MFCGLLLWLGISRADELSEAAQLIKAARYEEAMVQIDRAVAAKPRDPHARFLKGTVLAKQNKSSEAIAVFRRLSEEFPKLPEPYNNLAVLYARQGQYEKARVALETAMRTHPSYATTYENLGDVYTRLASQAYSKALKLNSENSSAQAKLALIDDLLVGTGPPPRVGVESAQRLGVEPDLRVGVEPARRVGVEPARRVEAEPAPSAARQSDNTDAPATAAPLAKQANTKPPAEPAAQAAVTEPVSARPARTPPPQDVGSQQRDAIKTLRAWAQAWARQDVARYLSFYATGYVGPGSANHSAWRAERRARITRAKRIQVSLRDLDAYAGQDGTVTVRFIQDYRSDRLTSVGTAKRAQLRKFDGQWRIVDERMEP